MFYEISKTESNKRIEITSALVIEGVGCIIKSTIYINHRSDTDNASVSTIFVPGITVVAVNHNPGNHSHFELRKLEPEDQNVACCDRVACTGCYPDKNMKEND